MELYYVVTQLNIYVKCELKDIDSVVKHNICCIKNLCIVRAELEYNDLSAMILIWKRLYVSEIKLDFQDNAKTCRGRKRSPNAIAEVGHKQG